MATKDPYAQLVDHLAATRTALRAAVDAVPHNLRERKPAPETWSVAQVIEHLGIVERRLTDLVRAFVAQAPATGPDVEVIASIVDSIDMAALRDRSRRIAARETSLPTRGLGTDAAWLELEQARQALLTVIEQARAADLSALQQPHPAFGPLDGYQWLAFIAGHEARHTDQIREIANTLSHSV